jgi:predicted transcriptional regulator
MTASTFENVQISRNHGNRKGESKSKLELYENTLEALVYNEPMKLELIMEKSGFSRSVTLENLNFLVKNNLVEKRTSNLELIYSITKRGERVVSFFGKASNYCSTFTKHSII